MNSKDCRKCEKRKDISEFYSKGSRIDSCCKQCVLKNKKIIYKEKKKQDQELKKKVRQWNVLELFKIEIDFENLNVCFFHDEEFKKVAVKMINKKIHREAEKLSEICGVLL